MLFLKTYYDDFSDFSHRLFTWFSCGDTHHGIESFLLVVLHDAVWLAVAVFFFCPLCCEPQVLGNIFNSTVPTRWRQRAFLSCRRRGAVGLNHVKKCRCLHLSKNTNKKQQNLQPLRKLELLFSYHNWKHFMSSKTSDVGSLIIIYTLGSAIGSTWMIIFESAYHDLFYR